MKPAPSHHRPSRDPAPATAGPSVEAIALAYLTASGDNPGLALRRALTDLAEANRVALQRDRLVSFGFVRGGLGDGLR